MTGSNHVPLFLRIMDNRNFLPALSMELLFVLAAVRNVLMFPTIWFLILVFLKAVFIRDIMPEHTEYKQFKFTSDNCVHNLKVSAHFF